ncbi:MAG: protoporphyrinogen oxidase [Planctomycetes bacterium]|nr:protoporphyrinogen oxidase [Planctomycetota bacterium]
MARSADVAAAPHDLVVVGGGLAGLLAAWRARRADPTARVVVLESAAAPGGVVASERHDGFLVERAASSIRRGAAAIHALIEELGLAPELCAAGPAAARRFVLHRGRLCAAPSGPLSLLATPLIAPLAKLRLLREPFVARRAGGPHDDETLARFIERRFGRGMVAPLLDAVVTGIFAGDPERLEARSVFPRMVALEERHGSLVRSLLHREAPPPRPLLAALRGGTGALVAKLAAALPPDALRCGVRVTRLARAADGTWQIDGEQRPGFAAPERLSWRARQLCLALPAWEAAPLLAPLDGALAAELAAIAAANVAVVAIGVRREQIGADVDALGFLVPKGERRPLLGVLHESALFPERAPAGHVLLRAMVGGERLALPDDPDAIAQLAFEQVAPLLRIDGTPRLLAAFPHRPGIPQYRPGHAARLARIDARLAEWPGLLLRGWSYRGIALDDRAREASAPSTTIASPPVNAAGSAARRSPTASSSRP